MFSILMACLLIVVPKVTSDSSHHLVRQHVVCIQTWLREETSHVSVESNSRNCVVGVVTKGGLKKTKNFNLTFNDKDDIGINYTYGCRKDKKGTGTAISMYCSVRRTCTRSSDANNYTERPSNSNTFTTGRPANNTINTPTNLSSLTEIQNNIQYNTLNNTESSSMSDTVTNTTTASKSTGTPESNETEQPPFTNSTTTKHLWKTQSDMTTQNPGYTHRSESSNEQTTSASRSSPKVLDCSGCCGRPPVIEHAVVYECSDEKLVYACTKGFNATRPITVICGINCTWTKTNGQCRGPCGKPPVLKHAFLRSIQADVAMYKCSKGYVNTGRHLTTSCRKGKWRRPEGKCKVSFKKPVVVGKFKDKRLTEVSGLAASRQHPGYFYSHNDYHNKPELFLINIKTVKIVAVYTLIGAKNNDWEDIALGPCKKGENTKDSCVFIGDFGGHADGHSFKPANIIYKVQEPAVKRSMHVRLMGKFHFSWDGSNADTLLMTPSGHMYAITSGLERYIYFFSSKSFEKHHTVRPQKLHKIYTRSTIRGGDVSPDGTMLVLGTVNRLYYWEVEGEHVGADTANSKPRYIKKSHMYGGGTAFNLDSSGVYVLNEDREPLYFFERRGMT